MKSLRPSAVLASVFILISACTTSPHKQSTWYVSPDRLVQVGKVLESYVQQKQLAGSVLLVKHRDNVVYHKAFGYQDLTLQTPMETGSIFRIASQTKAIVSVAVMMLQEQGKLLLQHPVSRYLPEYKHTVVARNTPSGDYEIVKAQREITIRDLLTHTSGIGYGHGLARDEWQKAGVQGWYFSGTSTSMREIVRKIASLPQDNQPGSKFTYGYSTDILGVIIEEITGLSLDDYLQQAIFQPLAMNDTHFYLPESKQDRLAIVYRNDAKKGLTALPQGAIEESQGLYHKKGFTYSAGAGLVSTAEDYGRFLQMLLNGGKYKEYQLLSPVSVQLMTQSHLQEDWMPGLGFGLGFAVVKDPARRGIVGNKGEFGWGGAYHSTYWVDPESKLIVVYLSQLLPADNIDDHDKLRTAIYQALIKKS